MPWNPLAEVWLEGLCSDGRFGSQDLRAFNSMLAKTLQK